MRRQHAKHTWAGAAHAGNTADNSVSSATEDRGTVLQQTTVAIAVTVAGAAHAGNTADNSGSCAPMEMLAMCKWVHVLSQP